MARETNYAAVYIVVTGIEIGIY